MIGMSIKLDGSGWPEIKEEDTIIADGGSIQLSVLPGGMATGLPSVAIRIDLPDGKHLIAQTSARLFVGAAKAIEGRYPTLFVDAPPGRTN